MSEKKHKLLDCGHRRDLQHGIVHLGETGKSICAPCNDRRLRAAYKPEVLRRERRPLKVGFTTLVGVMGFAEPDGPCSKCGHDHVEDPKCVRYGDGITAYCSVDDCGGMIPTKDPFPVKSGNCCSILNMWSENVREALNRWPDLKHDCEMEVVLLRGRERFRVVDSRIPDDWKGLSCPSCGVYEDDSEPMPYPTAPPETGFFYAPYVPEITGAGFDLSEFKLSKNVNVRKLKGRHSVEAADDLRELLDEEPEDGV